MHQYQIWCIRHRRQAWLFCVFTFLSFGEGSRNGLKYGLQYGLKSRKPQISAIEDYIVNRITCITVIEGVSCVSCDRISDVGVCLFSRLLLVRVHFVSIISSEIVWQNAWRFKQTKRERVTVSERFYEQFLLVYVVRRRLRQKEYALYSPFLDMSLTRLSRKDL